MQWELHSFSELTNPFFDEGKTSSIIYKQIQPFPLNNYDLDEW